MREGSGCGGDWADGLGEDIAASDEGPVRYGEPTGLFDPGFATDVLTDLSLP